MNWLVMKMLFTVLPTLPLPLFAKPIARALPAKVKASLIEPNLNTARDSSSSPALRGFIVFGVTVQRRRAA